MKRFRIHWRNDGPSNFSHDLASSATIAGSVSRRGGTAYAALDALEIGECYVDDDGDVWVRES